MLPTSRSCSAIWERVSGLHSSTATFRREIFSIRWRSFRSKKIFTSPAEKPMSSKESSRSSMAAMARSFRLPLSSRCWQIKVPRPRIFSMMPSCSNSS